MRKAQPVCPIFHTICKENEGLAMGVPIFSIFSEIYLQYIENTKFYDVLIKSQIEDYFRYVDYILIIYKESKTNIHDVLDAFNSTVPNLSFTLEEEAKHKINFLDVTIPGNEHSLNFSIYRKPSFTDTIIPNDSCHPREHNLNPTSTQMEYEKFKQIVDNIK